MFTSWPVARLFGIEIRVHAITLFVLAFFAATLDVFTREMDGRPYLGLLLDAGMVVAVFGCVLLHELGHALTAQHLGLRVRSIVLHPLGGMANIEGFEGLARRPWKELLVTANGPLVNLALWGIFSPLAALAARQEMSEAWSVAWRGFTMLADANLALLVFNMVPAIPMDGGRVLRSLVATRMGYLRATEIAVDVGKVFCLLMGFAGFFGVPGYVPPHTFMLVLIAFLIYRWGAQELAMARAYHAAESGGYRPFFQRLFGDVGDVGGGGGAAGVGGFRRRVIFRRPREEISGESAGQEAAGGEAGGSAGAPLGGDSASDGDGDEAAGAPSRPSQAGEPHEIRDAEHFVRTGADQFAAYRQYLEELRRKASGA
ncbi:MAG: M50 family metallopeptidase [Planctomycetes bacterium]|nr:M50 family metallopeptidase [Planctomycetota bacterium]